MDQYIAGSHSQKTSSYGANNKQKLMKEEGRKVKWKEKKGEG